MEQVQPCTNLARQVTFPAHTEQGIGINVTAYQKKEKNEEMRTGKRKAGE